MKFAAIDIGSNAVRLLIQEVFESADEKTIRKIALTRVPLRLGDDVFKHNKISVKKINQLVRTMKAFWNLMDVHDVLDFKACATSAMREASNNEEVIDIVRNETNINIEVISGHEEADLIFSNFAVANLDMSKDYLYIDVGGGSTELTLIRDGKRVKSKSFALGTVRMLQNKVENETWKAAYDWLDKHMNKEDNIIGIGTGGNINKIFKERGKKPRDFLTYEDINKVYEYVRSFNLEERIVKLKLKPDRADVIVPAALIYLKMMKHANVKQMIVPKVGLSDGIILGLVSSWRQNKTVAD